MKSQEQSTLDKISWNFYSKINESEQSLKKFGWNGIKKLASARKNRRGDKMDALYKLLWQKGLPGGGAILMIALALCLAFGGLWVAAMWTLIPGIIMIALAPVLAISTLVIVGRGIYFENVHRLNERLYP